MMWLANYSSARSSSYVDEGTSPAPVKSGPIVQSFEYQTSSQDIFTDTLWICGTCNATAHELDASVRHASPSLKTDWPNYTKDLHIAQHFLTLW